jgi:hypothetical protein
MYRVIHIGFVMLLFAAGSSSAAIVPKPAIDVTTLVQQARTKGLASHSNWMALIHYRRNALSNDSGVVSEIISPDFFVSPQGATDPVAELTATLVAFFDDPGKEPDRHAQCRFIARYRWLRKSLDWGSLTPPPVTCQKFGEWSLNGNIESLSLVFATGYLDNPASFYGHILLKFNTGRDIIASDLLDQTINYGAIVPKNEIGLVYVFKGLFGGYDATFSHERFYRHNHMYGENELRDMWEYKLALTRDQVDQIVAHSWELLGNKFVYYFVNQNCAYRMGDLLESVINQPLLSPNVPWSIPAAIFDRLVLIKNADGTPIVQTVRRIPSRANRFYEKYSSLNSKQQHVTKKLVEGGLNLEDVTYRDMVENDKIAIIDALLDYYEFRIIADGKNTQIKQAKHKLLIERAGLSAQKFSVISDSSDASPPHEGPLPSMLRLGLVHNSRLGSGMELRLRPAYYDSLALDAGRLPNSSLTMFDFRLIYADDRLRFRSLDFVNIETLNLSRTPLPGDGGLAWKFKFGFENQDLGCNDCTIFNVVGGIGKGTSVLRSVALYGMVDLNAQTKYQDSGTLGATAWLGLLGSPTAAWKYQLTVGKRNYLNGSRSSTSLVRWENRFGSDRKWDVRVNYEENVDHEFQVAVSFYW